VGYLRLDAAAATAALQKNFLNLTFMTKENTLRLKKRRGYAKPKKHYFLLQISVIGIYCLLCVVCGSGYAMAQSNSNLSKNSINSCRAELKDSTLTLENNRISRTYRWNNGNLISTAIIDKKTNHAWQLNGNTADCIFPGTGNATNGRLETVLIKSSTTSPAYLSATVTVMLGTLEVKRVFRIYPDCPAIACDYYLRGGINAKWLTDAPQNGEFRNIENNADLNQNEVKATVMESLGLPGKHWRLKAVQFFDITDRNNTLVNETHQLLYRAESTLKGNLLFANELNSDNGLFILKEAPTSDVQLAYPGFDFLAKTGDLRCVGIGITPADLDNKKWTRCYGFVTGVTSGGELGSLSALRTYQQRIRLHTPGRDEMVMMNTWGDRAQDSHIAEAFILKELVAANRFGISHFQIDDGWQSGRSANSAFKGGSLNRIWSNPDYWKPDPKKFPDGLTPVMDLAKKLGIEICIWFNPSQDSSYRHWRDDAGALISLYRHYGIRTFKIDGVQIKDKAGEVNFRKMLDTVMQLTNRQAVFNLDVTAGRRNGYHYFNEYGNIFLENRYTDWGNYYPHWTLRNLWQLSKYVPPQNLQIEFLNNARNVDKYPADDRFAPSKVTLDYEVAITLMAQPLAWMEATGLPEKAFETAALIKKYRQLQTDIHRGQIFPIGDEPSGTSWTGFQSVSGNDGYLLIIRELNKTNTGWLKSWLPADKKITLTKLLGDGTNKTVTTNGQGELKCYLPLPNSYVLYHYHIN
jgi:hypothetical protein